MSAAASERIRFPPRATKGKPRLQTSFLVMTDTHFLPPGTGEDMTWWNRMLKARGAEIADCLRDTVKELTPDFIVHCGDFTDDGELKSFRFGKSILDACGCPYYITLGNHDTWLPGTRGNISRLFGNRDGKFYYARDLGGMRFVFLDCAYWITREGREHRYIDWDFSEKGGYLGIGPTREELDWLERELRRGRPSVVVTHAPIFSKPTYPVGSLPMGEPVRDARTSCTRLGGDCIHRDELLRIITQAPSVKAVFAGHWHITDVAFHEGVAHCQTGAMIEYPFEMRLVRSDGRRLSISTVGLNDPSFAEDSLLAELRNEWVAGDEDSRQLSLELN